MSRIGNSPITIPEKVEVKVEPNNIVTVKGPNGTLTKELSNKIKINIQDSTITFERLSDDKEARALHGLTRALVNNMVIGVTEGFKKVLEINGVGYRANKQGKKLVMALGFSHPVEFEEPEGIKIDVEGQNKITISGADKELVGQLAAEIRFKRPPEPYKGKGIKYADEHIRRKEGKSGK